ncbi:uncharacterized protein [Nicotiana sylvestris]|uniref:uncharacterized protein n=1 Tax=Nicotiana sylvestris TaxID=4096 RepID=UPI00388CC407
MECTSIPNYLRYTCSNPIKGSYGRKSAEVCFANFIEKSVSESGSSVLDDGDACNAKISPLKTYDKKTTSANKQSAVGADDDFNFSNQIQFLTPIFGRPHTSTSISFFDMYPLLSCLYVIYNFVHSTTIRRNAMENGKTEQSLTDITNRLNSPQLCSASIKISEQVSSSQSQPQYPNSTEQQHFRYDFSPSKLQSDHLLQDLNDQPLLQGNASEKGKMKQSLTDITHRVNFPQFNSTPIKSYGQVSSCYSQPQYPKSMQQHSLLYGSSSSNLQKEHLLPDLNEIPLFQEFEDDNIDADIPDDDVFEDDEVQSWMTNEEYWDIGDANYECEYCGAYFWFEKRVEKNQLHAEIVNDLRQMLDENNVLAKSFRMVRDQFQTDGTSNVRLRLIGKRGSDGRRYNLPTVSEVAALIVGDFEQTRSDRDITVKSQSGQLQRINELNAAYLGLQYPLLFPYGEDGYREDIPLNDIDDSAGGRKCVSTREYLSYKIQERKDEVPSIVSARRLFQQFLVDGYTMMESSRLRFIRLHQKQLRAHFYNRLQDAVLHGDIEPSSQGQRVILSSSFTGGARYMLQNYQDAMAICKWAGYPDLFITFTCNPKWPEITKFVESRGLSPEDRPDILTRVFKIKLDRMIKDLRDNKVFGEVKAVIYTVEFQKRGLPHAHILLFLVNKYPTVGDIDGIISAELLDKKVDPYYYNAVTNFMMHGPCGTVRKSSPCMQNVVNRPTVKESMFVSWFEANKTFAEARELTYAEFSLKFVWKQNLKKWEKRKTSAFSIGRIFFVPPSFGEQYYLRLLLNIVKGPKGYEDLKKINGSDHETFRDACYALGLLDDDKEYVDAIMEVSNWGMTSYLRQLFAMLLLSNSMSRPESVWQATWHLLSEDILYEERRILDHPEAHLTDEELKNHCLQKLETFLKGCGRSFLDFPTMPRPVYNTEEVDNNNRLIRDELRYNKRALAEEHQQLVKNLTDEQKSVYEKIIRDVNEDKGGFFFLYGFGGTGKTFIWRTLSSAIRSRGDIVLTVASSGIASLLLPGGRTAHSRFVIPLNVTEDSTCNIKQGNEIGTHLDELRVFSDWILAIGDGIVGTSVDGNEKVQIPDDLLIKQSVNPTSAIVESTYPNFNSRCNDIGYLQQRAILTPTLDMVESINEYMISLNESTEKSYLSSDTICNSDSTYSALEHVHTPEFLNTIKYSGVPNHALTLKVGIPVMLIITKLGNQVIEAKVLAGQMAGQKVFIPRMTLTPSDARIPFKFQRRQFPIIVSFAMTINKTQGQLLSHVGLFFKKSVFTHEQLYVALSRVTSRKGLKILGCDDDGNITTEATNVVFKEVFRNLVVTGIALPSSSDKLYSGSTDKIVRVWDCQSGQVLLIRFHFSF